MKYKILVIVILFIFSFLYLKNGIYFVKKNDKLMKTIKEKQSIYNIEPINAIITKRTMIPGISGRKINLEKSYQKMKGINSFQESLLVFDEIKPNISIAKKYDKVIISGNQNINKISLIQENDNRYCFVTNLDTLCDNKYNILVERITSNHLNKVKELARNGAIFFLEINNDYLKLIIKYLKNNGYEIVPIDELINE